LRFCLCPPTIPDQNDLVIPNCKNRRPDPSLGSFLHAGFAKRIENPLRGIAAPDVRNIQSTSPFGPATKPSRKKYSDRDSEISKVSRSLSVAIHTRPGSISTSIRRTPAPQPRPGVVIEDDSTVRMFTAPQPRALNRITEEDHRILRDSSEGSSRCGPAPTHRRRITVEFPYQIRLASAAINQADIQSPPSCAVEGRFSHSPDRATKHLGPLQIFRSNSYP